MRRRWLIRTVNGVPYLVEPQGTVPYTNDPLWDSILSHKNSVRIFELYCYKIHFNDIHQNTSPISYIFSVVSDVLSFLPCLLHVHPFLFSFIWSVMSKNYELPHYEAIVHLHILSTVTCSHTWSRDVLQWVRMHFFATFKRRHIRSKQKVIV